MVAKRFVKSHVLFVAHCAPCIIVGTAENYGTGAVKVSCQGTLEGVARCLRI